MRNKIILILLMSLIINISVKKVVKIKQNDQIENMDYIGSRLEDDQDYDLYNYNADDDGYVLQDEDGHQELYDTEEPYESGNQGDQDFYFNEESYLSDNEGNVVSYNFEEPKLR